ncbi:MAG: hypothetical protein ACT4P7_18265 [Gemmatimonadaceae bacterium]
MFEDIRRAFEDLLNGNVAPGDRRELLQEMRDTLVRAKLAMDDLRVGVDANEKKLARERAELETVRRRKGLAESRGDAETVAVAIRFEAQQLERVTWLEKKLDVAQGELAMVEREVEEMTVQYKAALAGVGSGLRSGAVDDELDPTTRDADLDRNLRSLDRQQRKAASEAEADARLAELKRRMGL